VEKKLYLAREKVTKMQIGFDVKPVVGWKNALLCDPEQVLRPPSTPEGGQPRSQMEGKPVVRMKFTRTRLEGSPKPRGNALPKLN
jgi:hypothetical protein